MLEQREAARKEMERQRQIEWQKQRLQELLQQKQKEHERVALLRARHLTLTTELNSLVHPSFDWDWIDLIESCHLLTIVKTLEKLTVLWKMLTIVGWLLNCRTKKLAIWPAKWWKLELAWLTPSTRSMAWGRLGTRRCRSRPPWKCSCANRTSACFWSAKRKYAWRPRTVWMPPLLIQLVPHFSH